MPFCLEWTGENEDSEEFQETEAREIDSSNNLCHPAFRNTLILTRLFELLEYKDLCASRLVCSSWRNLAEYEFRRQSRFSFLIFPVENPDINKLSSRLSEALHQLLSRMPDNPTAVGIHPSHLFPHSEPVMRHFLNTERKNISGLRARDIAFKNANGDIVENYDIKTLIGEKNIWLTSLKLSCCQFVISLRDIPSIKELQLSVCTIKLDGGRISPRKVCLSGVQFIRENNAACSNTFVNEFLDFDQIKTLDLFSFMQFENKTIRLDMSKAGVNVDFLELDSMEIDWGNAKWNVRKLRLAAVPFLQKTKMEIKCLEIETNDKEIDLAALPENIERIYLQETTVCSSTVSFPKLKYLKISNTRCASLLPHFSKCTNLKSLELTFTKGSKIVVSDIPRSVENIKVHFTDDWLEGSGQFVFKKLVLGWQNIPGVIKQFDFLKPEHLVIDGCFTNQKDLRRILELINGPFKSVAVGGVLIEIKNLNKHPFYPMVDEIGEYYLFSNGRGKCLNKYDFKKIHSQV